MGLERERRFQLSFLITGGWILANVACFTFEYFNLNQREEYFYTRNFFGHSILFSRGAAQAINFNLSILLFTVCRNLLAFIRSIFPKEFGFLFDNAIYAHKRLSYAIIIWSIAHIGAHYYNFLHNYAALSASNTISHQLVNNGNLSLFKIMPAELATEIVSLQAGVSGILLTLVFFIVFTSSAEPIRRSFYNLFYYLHHFTFLIFPLLYWHGNGHAVKRQVNLDVHDPAVCSLPAYSDSWNDPGSICPEPVFQGSFSQSWKWFILSVGFYTIERIIRFFHFIWPVDYVSHEILPSDVLQLKVRKSTLSVRKNSHFIGQYVYVKLPAISIFEWHPFTLTSAPEDGFLQVHIRSAGDWTQNAIRLFKENQAIPKIIIDGPYGAPAQGLDEFQTIICAGTGIGITPFASYVRSAMIRKLESRIYFVWIAPRMDCFEWFDDLLRQAEAKVPFLRVMIFLTLSNMDPATAQDVIYAEVNSSEGNNNKSLRKNFGRPNWDKIFDEVARTNQNANVGVFSCGPKPFTDELRDISKKKSTDQLEFTFFKENF